MKREEKIQFLKNVEAGKASIREALMPAKATYYKDCNGLYTTTKDGGGIQLKTEAEFKAHIEKHPAKHILIFACQKGNEPLQNKYNG